MDAKELAALLLVGHVIAVAITLLILVRQIKIFRSRPDPELRAGRWVLLILACVIGLANIVPITIDAAVILGHVYRPAPSLFGIAYAISNVLNLIFSASALLSLYVIADRLLKRR